MLEEKTVNNALFFVDKAATRDYKSLYNEPCDCLACANYFQAIRGAEPVTLFLADWGVNVERPEECAHLETDFSAKTLDYTVWYSVCGRAPAKECLALADGTTVEIYPPADSDTSPNTDRDAPFFWLRLTIRLPWLLAENIKEV